MTPSGNPLCLVAPDVKLGRDVRIYSFTNLYGCEVGDESRIGSSVTILGGLTVGECAMVGAGSVVTKDVPPYAVVAGNPARVLRRLAQSESDDGTLAAPSVPDAVVALQTS